MVVLTSFVRQKIIIILLLQALQKNEREYWVHPINEQRYIYGDERKITKKYHEFPDRFQKELRVTTEQFDALLELLLPELLKSNIRRKSITPRLRLYVTLRFLGHGASQQQLADSFCLGHSTVCKIVNETTRAIWKVLSPIYMKPPDKSRWREIASDFETLWQFPHCIGALDGKHVIIQKPFKSGSIYYNYKKSFSINLMAICDAQLRFVMIDDGSYGRQNDSGVFRRSPFGMRLLGGAKNLHIPKETFMPMSTMPFPYMLVADEAFPLHEHIFKPFPGSTSSRHHRIYNYRLSRARRTIENAFGVMATKFRIFRNTINAKPKNVDFIVKASCVLHNFLRTWDLDNGTSTYCTPGLIDVDNEDGNEVTQGSWRNRQCMGLNKMGRIGTNTYSKNLKVLREQLALYFVHNFPVSWQDSYVDQAKHNPIPL